MTPDRLLSMWRTVAPHPGGRWLFSILLGRLVPYTGSIGARVRALAPGHCTVGLRDRRSVRNHLGSIHAVALVNLAEVSSGLAMLTAAGPRVRGIVTSLRIEYHRKARGPLRAEGRAAPPAVLEQIDADATAEIFDERDMLVASAVVTWRLAPA